MIKEFVKQDRLSVWIEKKIEKKTVIKFFVLSIVFATIGITLSNVAFEYQSYLIDPLRFETAREVFIGAYSELGDLPLSVYLTFKILGNMLGYFLFISFKYIFLLLVLGFALTGRTTHQNSTKVVVLLISILLIANALSFTLNGVLTMVFGIDHSSYVNMYYFFESGLPIINNIYYLINPFIIYSIYTILRQEKQLLRVKSNKVTIVFLLIYSFISPLLSTLLEVLSWEHY